MQFFAVLPPDCCRALGEPIPCIDLARCQYGRRVESAPVDLPFHAQSVGYVFMLGPAAHTHMDTCQTLTPQARAGTCCSSTMADPPVSTPQMNIWPALRPPEGRCIAPLTVLRSSSPSSSRVYGRTELCLVVVSPPEQHRSSSTRADYVVRKRCSRMLLTGVKSAGCSALISFLSGSYLYQVIGDPKFADRVGTT